MSKTLIKPNEDFKQIYHKRPIGCLIENDIYEEQYPYWIMINKETLTGIEIWTIEIWTYDEIGEQTIRAYFHTADKSSAQSRLKYWHIANCTCRNIGIMNSGSIAFDNSIELPD